MEWIKLVCVIAGLLLFLAGLFNSLLRYDRARSHVLALGEGCVLSAAGAMLFWTGVILETGW